MFCEPELPEQREARSVSRVDIGLGVGSLACREEVVQHGGQRFASETRPQQDARARRQKDTSSQRRRTDS